jgi:CotH kinase protein
MRMLPVVSAALLATGPLPVSVAQTWPDVFDPLQVLSLHLEMTPEDWLTVQNDESFEIEVPAMFWGDGETPIQVSVRRKSAEPLQNGTPFKKVALKIDMDEFVGSQSWRGLKKLSLENGAESDAVSEGIAWHLNRLASGPEGYGYEHPAAMAAWVRLEINAVDTGVYLSVEQRDKRFMQNRGLFIEDECWFYEVEDPGQLQFEVGEEHSPTVMALCYEPFEFPGTHCPTPGPAALAAELPQLVNMRSMLTMAGVDAFIGNPDGIFSHAKNFFFMDFLTGRERMYIPWDLDAVMVGNPDPIYATETTYASVMLGVPEFRVLYSQILRDLLCGPLRESELIAFLDAIEPVLSGPLAADPNNQLGGGTVAEFFDGRRAWISERIPEVIAQIEGFVACPAPCYADCNADGSLTVADFGCFQTRFVAADPYADCNADGSLTVADFGCFQTQFVAGCP